MGALSCSKIESVKKISSTWNTDLCESFLNFSNIKCKKNCYCHQKNKPDYIVGDIEDNFNPSSFCFWEFSCVTRLVLIFKKSRKFPEWHISQKKVKNIDETLKIKKTKTLSLKYGKNCMFNEENSPELLVVVISWSTNYIFYHKDFMTSKADLLKKRENDHHKTLA